jgi:hypothetical protein
VVIVHRRSAPRRCSPRREWRWGWGGPPSDFDGPGVPPSRHRRASRPARSTFPGISSARRGLPSPTAGESPGHRVDGRTPAHEHRGVRAVCRAKPKLDRLAPRGHVLTNRHALVLHLWKASSAGARPSSCRPILSPTCQRDSPGLVSRPRSHPCFDAVGRNGDGEVGGDVRPSSVESKCLHRDGLGRSRYPATTCWMTRYRNNR